jgi:uridine kinase
MTPSDLLALPCAHRVRLIAIDGRAGSGKTTLAFRLYEQTGWPVIQLDDFISVTDLEGWWPRFEEEVLEPLFAGRDLDFVVRDWEADVYGDAIGPRKTLPWEPNVIVEGVGANRLALADRVTAAIWVETPEELCLRRGIQRDHGLPEIEAVWRHWQAMEREFFAREGCRERAMWVVSGEPCADSRADRTR